MRKRYLLCAICSALATATVSAHDFWLAASDWTPAQGVPVTVTAGVGETFPTRTDFKSRPDWFDVWRVIGASGELPLTNDFQRRDLTMATEVTLPSAGAFLGVMRVTPRTIKMEAQEFTEYLKEEGLDGVIAARKAAGEADKPAKELSARYAKIAIRTGVGSGAHLTRPAGLKAELVPAADPTTIRAGGTRHTRSTAAHPIPTAGIRARRKST